MTQTPEFRIGTAQDAEAIVQLTMAAGDGINEYLLHDIMPGNDAEDLLAMAVMDLDTVLSYENTIVADINGEVAGIATCYASDLYGMPEDLIALVPDDRVLAMGEFLDQRVDDSLYLHVLAVDPRFQRQGLASALVGAVGALADDIGLEKISLHVWSDNAPAVMLYRKIGFDVAREIAMPRDPLLHHEGCMYLMSVDTVNREGDASGAGH